MTSIDIIYDEKKIDSLFVGCFGTHSRRSLQNDYKRCFEKKIEKLKVRVARDLSVEINKPLSSFDRLRGIKPQDKVLVVKLRIADTESNKGKQGGYRCIVLIDLHNHQALLLHIYHKKFKTNLSSDDIKDFAKFHLAYIASL